MLKENPRSIYLIKYDIILCPLLISQSNTFYTEKQERVILKLIQGRVQD